MTRKLSDAERARRLRLMGGVLPESTRDDTDEGWGEQTAGTSKGGTRDDEIVRDVPPHHGS